MTSVRRLIEIEAQRAIALGWALIRLRGKRPVDRGWPASPGLTLQSALEWTRLGRHHNLGVNTGLSKLLVVDVDDLEWSDPLLAAAKTPCVRTGRGGLHFYFRMPEPPLGNSAGLLAPGVDTRGSGGQVVLPGSLHPETGEEYRWLKGRSPTQVTTSDLPREWRPKLRRKRRRRCHSHQRGNAHHGVSTRDPQRTLLGAVERVALAKPGTRNDILYHEARGLRYLVRRGVLNRHEVESVLYSAAVACGLEQDPSDGPRSIRATIASGLGGPLARDFSHD